MALQWKSEWSVLFSVMHMKLLLPPDRTDRSCSRTWESEKRREIKNKINKTNWTNSEKKIAELCFEISPKSFRQIQVFTIFLLMHYWLLCSAVDCISIETSTTKHTQPNQSEYIWIKCGLCVLPRSLRTTITVDSSVTFNQQLIPTSPIYSPMKNNNINDIH